MSNEGLSSQCFSHTDTAWVNYEAFLGNDHQACEQGGKVCKMSNWHNKALEDAQNICADEGHKETTQPEVLICYKWGKYASHLLVSKKKKKTDNSKLR